MRNEYESEMSLKELKREIRLKAKNGVDFIMAAAVCWFGLFIIWRFTHSSPWEKNVITFMVGGIMLPLAFVFSKIAKTNWKIKDNPLQPLGLWLNFAQLIYFPFLFFFFVKFPDYFIMAYAIITGAHLFPYAWFYEEKGYAIVAVIISMGAMLIASLLDPVDIFYVPLLTATFLLVLGIRLLLKVEPRIKKSKR
jgi:uncharacterized membrane protein YdcZ (DUF606 family)